MKLIINTDVTNGGLLETACREVARGKSEKESMAILNGFFSVMSTIPMECKVEQQKDMEGKMKLTFEKSDIERTMEALVWRWESCYDEYPDNDTRMATLDGVYAAYSALAGKEAEGEIYRWIAEEAEKAGVEFD